MNHFLFYCFPKLILDKFVRKTLEWKLYSEVYLKLDETSKKDPFTRKLTYLSYLTSFPKDCIFDLLQGPEYAAGIIQFFLITWSCFIFFSLLPWKFINSKPAFPCTVDTFLINQLSIFFQDRSVLSVFLF